jgi:hypothetical protein
MDAFDFAAQAELFTSRVNRPRRGPAGYKRFDRAADAIRFAMEELPAQALVGTFLEIGEERFNDQEIQRLYERPDYPLERRERAAERVRPPNTTHVVDISSGPQQTKSGRWARS